MQAAREDILRLEESATAATAILAELQKGVETQTAVLKECDHAARVATKAFSELQLKVNNLEEQIAHLNLVRINLVKEQDETRESLAAAMVAVANAHLAAEAAHEEAEQMQASLASKQMALQELDDQIRSAREGITGEKIVLARIEQRLEGLKTTLEQLTKMLMRGISRSKKPELVDSISSKVRHLRGFD